MTGFRVGTAELSRPLARLFILGITLAACAEPAPERLRPAEEPEADVETLPAVAAVVLDSANAAFEAGAWEDALRQYLRVTELAPEAGAAGWFGVYMTHQARGNVEAAAGALERAKALTPTHASVPPFDAAGGEDG